MFIENKFYIKDIVILITDVEKKERMITGIYVGDGYLSYQISLAETSSIHYDYEIQKVKKKREIGFINK